MKKILSLLSLVMWLAAFECDAALTATNDVKISQLPTTNAPSTSAIFPFVQNGVTVSATLGQILAGVTGQVNGQGSYATNQINTVSNNVQSVGNFATNQAAALASAIAGTNSTLLAALAGTNTILLAAISGTNSTLSAALNASNSLANAALLTASNSLMSSLAAVAAGGSGALTNGGSVSFQRLDTGLCLDAVRFGHFRKHRHKFGF